MTDNKVPVRDLLDRILTLKSEQDALTEDIREIYREAHSQGWNKTSMGVAVGFIRKRQKDPDKFDEVSTDADLYVQAYYGTGTVEPGEAPRARTREKPPREAYQEPRLAPLSEVKQAWKDGNPISGDATYWNASVYFAVCPVLGRIKVGVSNDVSARLLALAAEVKQDLLLIAAVPGNRQDEMRAHAALAEWRIAGEWFKDCPEIRAAIHKQISPESGKAPRGHTPAIPAGSNGGGGHDTGRVNPPAKFPTEVQRGQADKPTAPAPMGSEPKASEEGALASAPGAVQGRCEPTAPPIPEEDVPTFLRRGHPDNAWAAPTAQAGART